MKFVLYLIVAVMRSFASANLNGNSSSLLRSSTLVPSPTVPVSLTKTDMETSTGASDPSPVTQKVTSLTSYRAMSHPTPKVTNRPPNQTSTVNLPSVTTDIKSSPTAGDNVNVTSMSSNIRDSTFSVHDTTSNAFKSSSVKSSNAESMSKTSYSSNMLSRSSPAEIKTESVNIASASIQATGTTKVTSMQSSVIANESVDSGMSSSNMINQTPAMTIAGQTEVSSINLTSVVGTKNVRSSVVMVTESTHTSKSPVLVQNTVSPLVVNSSSSGDASSIRGITSVDQNTTTSSEIVTQASSKAIKTLMTSIYSNVSSTVNSSKPPIMVQPSTSPMIHPTTTSRSFTQSISPKMTTIQTSSSPIGVSSSSAIYGTASTSTTLINATTAIGRNMTTSQMFVNNTILSVMSTTGSSLRNSTTVPSMGISISVSPTSNLTTQSDSMPVILNRNKTSLTKNTTIASTPEVRSSLSVVQNTTTQLVVLKSTVSPVISVNRSSTMNGTIMASKVGSIDATMSILNVTTPLVMVNGTSGMSSVRKTNIQSYHTISSDNNTTIPSTQIMTISSTSAFTKPLITVNASASSMVTTSSVIVKNASMTSMAMNVTRSSMVTNTTSSATSNVIVNKTMPPMMSITMSPVIPSTSIISNVANQSLTVNVTMKMTNVVNPTISIMTNITTSSPLVNGTISSGNVTTLSVSRNLLTSGLIVSTTINASETLSHFVQSESMSQVRANSSTLLVLSMSNTASTSVHPTNNNTMLSAEVIKTMSPIVGNLSTMHVSSLVENMTSSFRSVSHSHTILSMSYSSRFPVTTPITQSAFVRIAINTACAEVNFTSDTFKSAVRSACSGVLNISEKHIIIKKVTCGSVIVDMEIRNVTSDSVIDKLNKAAENKTLVISYDGKNLTVASVTKTPTTTSSDGDGKTITVASVTKTPTTTSSDGDGKTITVASVTKTPTTTSSNGDGKTLTVTSVVKTPTTTSSDGDDTKVLIIYIVFGVVLGLAFLIGIIALIVRCHRERSTGMFHLPSEENLELSGFSVRTKSNHQGGNFYGELQPDSSQHRLSGIPNESDPVVDDLAGNTENGGGFGSAYLPAWESLPTIDMSEVSRKDEAVSGMNDNLLLTYDKKKDDERRDSDMRQGFVASFDNVGAI